MNKITSIIISMTILMLIAVSPVSANNAYEDNGDFRYIYGNENSYYKVLYKKSNSEKEIPKIEFLESYNNKIVDDIGFTNCEDDEKAESLKVNTIHIPKYVKEVRLECVDYPELCDSPERLISLRNIEVDKENPYLCSKDGVLYSKDMKTIHLYPNRNSMIVYKMPNNIADYTGSPLLTQRNNLKKLYLSDNLKEIGYYFAAKCKKLEYVSIGKKTKKIGEYAFYENKILKTVKIKSKKLKSINSAAFGYCKSLKKISIPLSVKKIDEFAFGCCKNLSKVYINNKKKSPKIVYNAFENTKKGIKFYVKNKKVAKSLKKQLKGSGVRNAKILVGKKVVYKNVK